MTKCTLRSRTIWTIFSVSGLPFPFYKMCVPSDLYLCYLQPLLSSPGWTPAKSALVSVAFFPLHCICLIVIRVYFIYRVFFPWTKKKLYIAIRVFPPLTYYLIPLLSSTCHHFHVPDVVGEWNRHHGNIYSDDAVFQESTKPHTSQSLHYSGYPRGCGQTFVLCVAGICH